MKLEANSTNTSTPNPANTYATMPSTTTDILVVTGLKSNLVLFPFGTDANGEKFQIYVYTLWPMTNGFYTSFQIEYTCDLSSENGVVDTDIGASDFPVDVFTLPNAANTTNHRVVDGVANCGGHMVVGCAGASAALVIGDRSTAATWNCLATSY